MTQYHVSKGLKIFGRKGTEAVMNELKQLHDRSVLDLKDPNKLSEEEKKVSLQYLMFLKKKRCGKIKGQEYADGRKQRTYTPKDDASTSTVATEALMVSCIIDAMKKGTWPRRNNGGTAYQAGPKNVLTVPQKRRGQTGALCSTKKRTIWYP
eukprot:13462932-Ditylum_brightwellii.AAC.1